MSTDTLAHAAVQGARVIAVARDFRRARTIFDEIRERPDFEGRDITANGMRLVHSEGGRIDFTTPRSHSARGTTADKLYFDEGVRETDELLAELVPCMATSTDGEILRA